jgi:ATP-binding cassette subfamily G (WHITE) protein 2 (SNQ2)
MIIGTTFLNLPESTAAYFSRGGVLFLSVPLSLLATIA